MPADPMRLRSAAGGARRPLAVAALLCACAAPAAVAPAATERPAAPAAGKAASHRPGPGRLPDEVAPTSYDLKITVDPRQPRFRGEVTIGLDVKSPTYTVNFHSQGLTLQSAVATAGGHTLEAVVSEAAGAGAEPDHGEKMATFPGTLPAGPASLRFVFDGPFNEKLTGLYRAKDEGERWYAYTQFETADARRAFPCMDEPRFKTPFRIELTIPDGMTAVGNTLEASRESRDGWTRVVFRETKPLPTYLVAFLVGDLDVVEGPKTTSPLRGIAPKGKGGMLADSLQAHAEILPVLEEYFGRPYPFDKLDAAALVEYAAGAMENAGLITYREELLLIDPKTSSMGRRRFIAMVIAHEVAHEWFGDFVTMPWWDDIWLNEAFATWMAAKAVDIWRPENREGESLLKQREGAFQADALADARAVRQPVNGLLDAESAFDNLTYAKGASIISMMEQWLGEETFRKGIRRFLDVHAYGSATAEDLFASLQEVSGKDVRKVAHTFLDRPGVPLISAEVRCPGDAPPSVVLTQSRYRSLGSAAPPGLPEGGPWSVPVCLAYPAASGLRRTCLLLTGESATETLAGATECPSWIHPDAGEFGYYRWSVPAAMAARLGSAVKQDWGVAGSSEGTSPAVRSRLMLLNQAWATVAAGRGDLEAYLSQMTEMSRGADRRVMEQVIAGIRTLAGIWDDLAAREPFRAFVRGVLEPEGKRLGWEPKADESADDVLIRPPILAALGRYGRSPWVLEGAAALSRKYLEDASSVPSEVASTALTLAAMEGKVSAQELTDLLKTARTPPERTNTLAALASLPPGRALRKSLELSLTDAVRVQDIFTIIFGALGRPESLPQTFKFVQKRFDEITRRMPGGFATVARLAQIVGNFCSENERDDARAFFEGKKLEGSARFLAQGIEEANQCIALKAFGREALASYLGRAGEAAE